MERKGPRADTWEMYWGALKREAEGHGDGEVMALRRYARWILTSAFPWLHGVGTFTAANFEPVLYPPVTADPIAAVLVDDINEVEEEDPEGQEDKYENDVVPVVTFTSVTAAEQVVHAAQVVLDMALIDLELAELDEEKDEVEVEDMVEEEGSDMSVVVEDDE